MPAYPLKVSASGRYLVDQDNVPVLLVGDDGYSLISQLNTTDATTYLADRHSRGFNTVWAGMTDNAFSSSAPNNNNGDAVFTGTNFTTPNTAWFNHVDTIVSAAAALDITLILTPLYLGNPAAQGWGAQVQGSNTTNLASFGTYIGNRYKNNPNIIWMIGGDVDASNVTGITGYSTPTDMTTLVGAFASALATADTNHVITAHPIRGEMATSPWGTSTSWLTVNDTYTTQLNTPVLAGTAYTQSPTLPFFQVEAYNENEHSMTAQGLRSQFYWTVLAGGCGHIFGNCPLWGFDYSGIGSFCTAASWQSNLATTGSAGIQYASQLFLTRQWYNLVPDSGHTIVTSSGTLGGSDYVTAAQSVDKTLLLAYMPVNATLTVNLSKMSQVMHARWYDPTNGAFTTIGTLLNTGTRTFTPSATNGAGDADWVLVLESYDPGRPAFRGGC